MCKSVSPFSRKIKFEITTEVPYSSRKYDSSPLKSQNANLFRPLCFEYVCKFFFCFLIFVMCYILFFKFILEM